MSTRSRPARLAPICLLWLVGCVVNNPDPVTVELVNETTGDVTPSLHLSAAATDATGLFDAANLVTDFTDRGFPELRPGETARFDVACEDVSALGVRTPIFFDPVTLLVLDSADEIVTNRDTEFGCGSVVRFVYFRDGDAFRARLEIE